MPLPFLGLLLFLVRTPLSGILSGGILTLAALHLWPQHMALPYEWVGRALQAFGLSVL